VYSRIAATIASRSARWTPWPAPSRTLCWRRSPRRVSSPRQRGAAVEASVPV